MKFVTYSGDKYTDIECNSHQTETEIEISGCNLSLSNQLQEQIYTNNYSIGHTYKLNKTTKYEFLHYLIDFKDENQHNDSFQTYIRILSILFPNSTRICEMPSPKTPNYTILNILYERNYLIYPCGIIDTRETVKAILT
ncbi:hypothetical protein RF11_10701 [Thelohanellus kitauei]|uniref:Uncharacterized protein n=1 Tax=Thelohanellus kitauei TaxID=669202 RepID=A0A0C2IJ84_THEKT|nr:hypothetical protein RF11_10701 [Thelohanellus kitauei]